ECPPRLSARLARQGRICPELASERGSPRLARELHKDPLNDGEQRCSSPTREVLESVPAGTDGERDERTEREPRSLGDDCVIGLACFPPPSSSFPASGSSRARTPRLPLFEYSFQG